MRTNERGDAAGALLAWFNSQSISLYEAVDVMAVALAYCAHQLSTNDEGGQNASGAIQQAQRIIINRIEDTFKTVTPNESKPSDQPISMNLDKMLAVSQALMGWLSSQQLSKPDAVRVMARIIAFLAHHETTNREQRAAADLWIKEQIDVALAVDPAGTHGPRVRDDFAEASLALMGWIASQHMSFHESILTMVRVIGTFVRELKRQNPDAILVTL